MVGFSICHVRFPRGLYTANPYEIPPRPLQAMEVVTYSSAFGDSEATRQSCVMSPGVDGNSLENQPKKGWIFFIAMFTDKYIWYMFVHNVYMYICNTYVYYYV